MKFKRILLTLFLGIGLIGGSIAGAYDDWTDDAVCMWLDMRPTNEGYKAEVQKRGIGCEGGKAVTGAVQTKKTTTSNTALSSVDKEITIYDVAFSPEVLEELLNLVISKTDYDFSKHKLSKNDKDIGCRFRITRIVYDKIEEGLIERWNIAEGNINIKGSNVEFGKYAQWKMGGLSSDPSYFRDEVNIKLTDDGHLVGKMAYFNLMMNQGETPINPLYPILTKHKRSTPINLNNIKNVSAKLYIDVEDWAGAVMYVSSCMAKQDAKRISVDLELPIFDDVEYTLAGQILKINIGDPKMKPLMRHLGALMMKCGSGLIDTSGWLSFVSSDSDNIKNARNQNCHYDYFQKSNDSEALELFKAVLSGTDSVLDYLQK
jgi:hypothetical protein